MSTPEAAQVNVRSDLLGIKPPSFDCWHDDNLPQKFKSFRRYCELIFSTPAYSSKPNSELVKYILVSMGPQAIELFDNWTLTEEQRHNPQDVWSAFQNYFEPKSNFRLARFQLRDLVQQANESIDTYVNRLKVQAQKCNFSSTNVQEDNIIDQIIKGTHHAAIRKQLLDHDPSKLTLNKVLDFARTFEATQSQLQQFSQAEASCISAVKKHSSKPTKPKQTQHKTNLCKFFGGPYHKRDVCPASGQSCNRCHKIGHWGKVCRSTDLIKKSPKNKHDTHQKSKPQHSQKQKVSTIQHDNFSSSDDDQPFDQISFGVISKNKSKIKTMRPTQQFVLNLTKGDKQISEGTLTLEPRVIFCLSECTRTYTQSSSGFKVNLHIQSPLMLNSQHTTTRQLSSTELSAYRANTKIVIGEILHFISQTVVAQLYLV